MAHNPRVGIEEKLAKGKNDEAAQLKMKGDALEEEINKMKAAEEGRKHCYQY